MILTHESPRWRWAIMAAVWTLVATLLLAHTWAARDHLALIDAQGLRGAPSAPTPLKHVVPLLYSDAQMWVQNALDLQETGRARVRFTATDNAPFGREVHWSSLLTWVIAGAGKARQALTGEPLPLATERSLVWLNATLLFALAVALSAWTAHRAGAGAGVLVALGMVGHRDFYDGFSPSYVDHHGLITTAIFGVMLGAVFMGAGWWRETSEPRAASLLPRSLAAARRAAVLSALCGAVGLWLSAASVIPAVAFAGLTGLGVTAIWGRSTLRSGAHFSADLWRLWGRVGAAASLGFYLLEYAPAHFGLRLEVNHPVYALAWWGGAELIALLAEWRLAAPGKNSLSPRRFVLPGLAVSFAPLVLLLGGAAVFVVRDPFVGRLSNHVVEGMSMPALLKVLGWDFVFLHVNESLLPALSVLVLLLLRGTRERLALAFALLTTGCFVALAVWEVRFWQSTAGPQLCLTLVAVAAVGGAWRARWRWLLVTTTAAGLFLPPAISRVLTMRESVQRRSAARFDLTPARQRDIAAALRASQPTGDIVLLACPSTSTGVGYYGRFKTVGTLYWENFAGLRAAAEIFCAPTEASARALLRQRGVTHIALTSEEDFLRDFFTLLRPEAPPADFEKTFGHQLFVRLQIPPWLRVLPYGPPPDLRWPGLRTLLLQVVPDQPEHVALYHIAAAQLATGDTAPAEATLLSALAGLPAADQAAFALNAGNLCYQQGARAAAARVYRAGFAHGGNLVLAGNFAWQLATDRDDAIRRGAEALALARQAVALSPDDLGAVNALAAALAETGDFPAAVTTATRALTLVRATGDKNAEAGFVARLESYRAGRPWRQ